MTNQEAWSRISAMFRELYHYRADNGKEGYSQEDIDAEIIVFNALIKGARTMAINKRNDITKGYEEAIKDIEDYMNHKFERLPTSTLGACINALEKQIPKKPKKYIALDGIERNGCPSCPRDEILYAGQKYCSVCGQKILWEVE